MARAGCAWSKSARDRRPPWFPPALPGPGRIARANGVGTRHARPKDVLELLLASCPQSKTIQDLASAHGIRQQRFKQEHEDCILCGLCVRICNEQMMSGAIGFRGRGQTRSIGTPFDVKSESAVSAAVACMSVRLPAPVHIHGSEQGDLRRLRQFDPALPGKREVRRHDVLHVAVCCL